MAETAKLMNPSKKVLLPDMSAGCSLSASITGDDVRLLKQKYPGVPVVLILILLLMLKLKQIYVVRQLMQ